MVHKLCTFVPARENFRGYRHYLRTYDLS
jgi:hypothetical protein